MGAAGSATKRHRKGQPEATRVWLSEFTCGRPSSERQADVVLGEEAHCELARSRSQCAPPRRPCGRWHMGWRWSGRGAARPRRCDHRPIHAIVRLVEPSVIHEWESAPHWHDRLHQFLLLSVGSGVARLDEAEIALPVCSPVNAPRTKCMPPSSSWARIDLCSRWPTRCRMNCWPRRRTCGGQSATPGSASSTRTSGKSSPRSREYAGRSPGRARVLRGLSGALLGRAARVVDRHDTRSDSRDESQLPQRFVALREAHYRAHWRAADYAGALAVTPTHLSRVLRAATGESASRLIDGRVIREARRQLAFTHLSVT